MKLKVWNMAFSGLLLSKWHKVSAKKLQNSYHAWHWRVIVRLKKNWLAVSNMTWVLWILWIFTQPLQSPKLSLQYFCPKYTRYELKKIQRGIIFHDTEHWCKIWIIPDLVISKLAWGIGWNFIRVLKVWKNVHEWTIFVKSI